MSDAPEIGVARLGPLPRVQALLNVLVESPVFYAEDDPELFALLRKHRAELARFYEQLYGWELFVDARMARLFKPRWHNRALRRSQRDVFAPSRKDECVGLLLVLEFHELREERGAGSRFAWGELFAFVRDRLREESGAEASDDDARRVLRAIVPPLLRFRFLREVGRDAGREDRREEAARGPRDPEAAVYECLPALGTYDVRALPSHRPPGELLLSSDEAERGEVGGST